MWKIASIIYLAFFFIFYLLSIVDDVIVIITLIVERGRQEKKKTKILWNQINIRTTGINNNLVGLCGRSLR